MTDRACDCLLIYCVSLLNAPFMLTRSITSYSFTGCFFPGMKLLCLCESSFLSLICFDGTFNLTFIVSIVFYPTLFSQFHDSFQ